MRRILTLEQAIADGVSAAALNWGVKSGTYQRIVRGVYVVGSEPPSRLEQALGLVMVTGGVASGTLAASLHHLDSVSLSPPYVTVGANRAHKRRSIRRADLRSDDIVLIDGFRCTNGLRTLFDLAPVLSDCRLEQVLESALRKKLVTINQIEAELVRLRPIRTPGLPRIRRVLGLRPHGASATGSLMETLMVQLLRSHTRLPAPVRQFELLNKYGGFVAYPDLSWPDAGLFLELDGQQHKDQPVYDARRETAVVAATGWLPGRFTWYEVNSIPIATARRVVELYEQAERRAA